MINIRRLFSPILFILKKNKGYTKQYSYNIYSGKKLFEALLLTIVIIPVVLIGGLISLVLFVKQKKILFKQERIGLNGRSFMIYKFKTLKKGTNVSIQKNDHYAYTSNLAKWLRRSGLDELPQFINVLKGEMSIIGPRPLIDKDLNHLTKYERKVRQSVKPGMTGLWQLQRKYDENDIHLYYWDYKYITNANLLFDIILLIRTVSYILFMKGK